MDAVVSFPFENMLLTPPPPKTPPPPPAGVGRIPKAEGRTAEVAMDDADRTPAVEFEDPVEAKRGSFSGRGSAWAAVADADLSAEEEALFLPLALALRACEKSSMAMMDG